VEDGATHIALWSRATGDDNRPAAAGLFLSI
jgi:hypothetical protein